MGESPEALVFDVKESAARIVTFNKQVAADQGCK